MVEAHDFFADHVDIGWPEFVEIRRIIATIAKCCDIVCECIEPNVNDVFRILIWTGTPQVKRETA